MFQDISNFCLSQIPFASLRNYSKTIPSSVLAKIQMHLTENIRSQFQMVSWPNSHSISSKLFKDTSKLCPSQIPIASHRNNSKTIPNCVLAKIQLHVIEKNSTPIPNCVFA